jgi:peptidyl-dipeptidase Dcp
MHTFLTLALIVAAGPALSAKKVKPPVNSNPLLAAWEGPHGGVPPFDKVKVEELGPALELGMKLQLEEIEAIANNPKKPTFDNTLAALERSGQPLSRAMTLFGVWSSSLSSPEFRKLEQDISPKLAAFRDAVTQNSKLFARIKQLHDAGASLKLNAEQQRLLDVTYTQYVRQGAALSAEEKLQLSQYNLELAKLFTFFSQNQLGDEENEYLVLEKRSDLAGLPEAQIAAAAAEAVSRGLPGKWVISNTRSSMEPFLTSSSVRSLREKGWKLWVKRGDNGADRDNNQLATEILKLRAKRAKLLGYPTFAHLQLADTMAKEPAAAMKLMLSVWKPASEQFSKDVAEAQKIVDQEKGGFQIEPWDYRYYAEKLRKAKYDLDLNELKPYLQLNHLRDAMFWSAQELYGLTFFKVDGLPTFHADVEVFEVKRGADHVGYWYFDPYARPGKQSGAWMSAYREQQKMDKATTLVSNNSNFVKAASGEPVTLSWDDARTMFHEFGHALHGLNSNVTYPSLSGTNTTRDFVEMPSQFNENFLSTKQVLKFLVNSKGEAIPESLVARMEKAATFNQGFSTAEALASAIVDMKLHLAGDTTIDTKAFEKTALAEINMPKQLVMRHRIPAFGHIFSGDGYAAGYYSYIWAEVLEHDVFEAFQEANNPYDKVTAKRLRDTIMSVGNTVDPGQAFRNFRGRDPKPDALLRSKGFPVVPST